MGAFANSMATLLMLRTRGDLQHAMLWILGGFSSGGWEPIFAILPYFLIGMGALLFMGRVLNTLQFGEEQAAQVGLDVPKARAAIILFASLLTAAGVAYSGIIGFGDRIIGSCFLFPRSWAE